MTRPVEEWIGATDTAKIPDRVKLRIWERERGRCHVSKAKIQPGQPHEYEHIIALCNGGEHREKNIALVLKDAHKAKTASDLKIRSKIDRIRKREAGIRTRKPNGFRGHRKFDGTIVWKSDK